MADSESDGGLGLADSDVENDNGPVFDPSKVTQLTDKDRKKLDQNLRVWRTFLDFLVRHVAIATYRYNCFEMDDLAQFFIALEKGDGIWRRTKLKKGEDKYITCFKDINETGKLLAQNQCLVDARRVRNFLDIAGRLRGLGMIANGFYKSLKKGKVGQLEEIKYYLEYWRGFSMRTFDYSQLNFRNVDPAMFGDLERKYKVWPAAVRTSLNLSQKFLKKASDATGLEMFTKDLKHQQKHMQTAEIIVATNIEDMMAQNVSRDATSFTPGSSLLLSGGKSKSVSFATAPGFEDLDVTDIHPELLQPIPDNGILLSLPSEVPKEKTRKKKGSTQKGNARALRMGSHKPESKKRKK